MSCNNMPCQATPDLGYHVVQQHAMPSHATLEAFPSHGVGRRPRRWFLYGRLTGHVVPQPAPTPPIGKKVLPAPFLFFKGKESRTPSIFGILRDKNSSSPLLSCPTHRDMLPRARDQPPDQTAAPEGAAGAGDRALDNDHGQHTGQEMFSCTTLATRTGKDYFIKSDGCMDYGFNRCGAGLEGWECECGGRRVTT
eukprot:366323-Chlamydomonas_euryale.AAC.7